MAAIVLKVNGRTPPWMLIRKRHCCICSSDELQLHGPKFGCGMAQWGACTVIIPGQAVRSYVMPVSAVEHDEVTNAGGLSRWLSQRSAMRF